MQNEGEGMRKKERKEIGGWRRKEIGARGT